MRRLLVLAVFALTGCATTAPTLDVVSFPRTQFAYEFGRISQAVTIDCNNGVMPEQRCVELKVLGESIHRQLMAPPAVVPQSTVDMEMMMRFLMGAAKMAL